MVRNQKGLTLNMAIVTRPTHTHACRGCGQPYRCGGVLVEPCRWQQFSNWDHCPACANRMELEQVAARMAQRPLRQLELAL